ncbi:MAG: hypothetical protein Q7K44_02080, partial [Candidatus Liptonbacteria bacterium]|nr:hypothetical protein [Candidatus Liptonbacteria bacterium]
MSEMSTMEEKTEAAPEVEKLSVALDEIIVSIKKAGQFSNRKIKELQRLLYVCERDRLEVREQGGKAEDGVASDDATLDKMQEIVDRSFARVSDLFKGFTEEDRNRIMGSLHDFFWRFSTKDQLSKDYGIRFDDPKNSPTTSSAASTTSSFQELFRQNGVIRGGDASSVSVADPVELGDNKGNMPNESLPPVANPAEQTPATPNAVKKSEEIHEVMSAPGERPLPEALRLSDSEKTDIRKILEKGNELERMVLAKGEFNVDTRRELERFHKEGGESILRIIQKNNRGVRLIPEEYIGQLPGDKYVRGKRNVAGQIADAIRSDLPGARKNVPAPSPKVATP